MVTIIKDRQLIYDLTDYDVVLVAGNIYNKVGNGFSRQLHTAYPEITKVLRSTPYGDKKKLGTVSVVETFPIICICFMTCGRFRPDKNPDSVDYEALARCLRLVAENFKGKKVVSTIMGHSIFEGNGDKERLIKMFRDSFVNRNMTLYDFEQTDINKDLQERWRKLRYDATNKLIDKEEYYRRKGELMWEKRFGVLNPMPEGLTDTELKKLIKQQ